ncbi:RNA-guided endonuclease InsQ/TnpB family protein [Nocardia sp. NPDC057663]|uniref:RNA-guided endonuclease InsQ/TnpB family protein n=1 Tax=Nocardia sp. NPDC057663 TaxID=3346201 RepID=UPI003670C7AC
MQLRYNFRVYPTPGQQISLARAFGCARVVYNDGLAARRAAFAAGQPYIKDSVLQTQVITAAKKTPERGWLGEVSSVVLVQALGELHTAYRNFLSSVTGKRKGAKVAPPRFQSRKDNRQSIRLTRNGFSVRSNQRLYVAKSVHDSGWGMFTRMLEEKAARYGRTFARVDRFFPSSQICSSCGVVDGPKPLSVREWQCPACGVVHDRDLNAAKNIHAAGRAEWLNACGETVSLPA